ncbi:hypothetical protein sS8_1588 [Methylocaldum marinum]|uniref:Uncharacterized protein n=1 Tax=Methylocaldum marinum TaxID=1432792 RepID=A0A250KPT3_9GAMM|nr:hypothetical protein [Methylocaldum marinum]BBA33546.1 hypothetical protein sS8_1588 [Methylocaldum marinum]
MNTVKASEPKIRLFDWQKSLTIILDHPVQTSLFIITFAFLLLVEPPVLVSLLLLSTLLYFIFALGESVSRVEDPAESSSVLTEEQAPSTDPAIAESFEAPSTGTGEAGRRPPRRTAQRGNDPQNAQANRQQPRRRASKTPK